MRIIIIQKFHNDSYDEFEYKINRQVDVYEKESLEIIDINIFFDGKQTIAIIKYK